MISYVGVVVSYVTAFFGVFPWWLSVPAVVILAVSIIYKVLGREGNNS